MTRISFHDNASKARFVAENGFTSNEIYSETESSIVIAKNNNYDFSQNGWVYQVTEM